MDTNKLLELVETKMPFGKYKGMPLVDLPEPYVVWMCSQGTLKGRLAEQFGTLYEVKLYGLEPVLEPLKTSVFKQS